MNHRNQNKKQEHFYKKRFSEHVRNYIFFNPINKITAVRRVLCKGCERYYPSNKARWVFTDAHVRISCDAHRSATILNSL